MPEEWKEPLLHALSRAAIPNIESTFRTARLLQGACLQLADPQPRYAHFLRSGAASASLRMTDGTYAAVRVSSTGDLLEMYHLLGAPLPDMRVTMLIPGEAVRVPYAMVKQAFHQDAPFRERVLGAVCLQSMETEQISVCNRLHQLEGRLARYLLMIQDRCGDATIPLTQESLSLELGVRRSSVALAAGVLRRDGLLAFRRGRIQILGRHGLEQLACPCYPAIRRLRSATSEPAGVFRLAGEPAAMDRVA